MNKAIKYIIILIFLSNCSFSKKDAVDNEKLIDIFKKEIVKIWNDNPKRDFIFTEDAADAVLKLIDTDFEGTINLGLSLIHI